MSNKILIAMAAIFALCLLGTQTAVAGPMKCSGEQTTCIANCQRKPRASVGDCIANCRARTNYCKQSGCWDDGIKRYCGLLRQ